MKSNLTYGLNNRLPLTLSPDFFHALFLTGVVVDGRAGGLILGRTFSQGGIYIIHQRGEDFVVHGSTENGEFVMNKAASVRNLTRLQKINAGLTKTEEAPPIEESILRLSHLIVTHAEPNDKFLWLNWHQTIVGKEQSKKHLAELVDLNEEYNPFAICDSNIYFPSDEPGTEDGII